MVSNEVLLGHLQTFIIDKSGIIPEHMQSKQFMKDLATYLNINTEPFNGKQRTHLYNQLLSSLKGFKRSNPNELSAKVLKAYLLREMRVTVEKMLSSNVKQEPKSVDEEVSSAFNESVNVVDKSSEIILSPKGPKDTPITAVIEQNSTVAVELPLSSSLEQVDTSNIVINAEKTPVKEKTFDVSHKQSPKNLPVDKENNEIKKPAKIRGHRMTIDAYHRKVTPIKLRRLTTTDMPTQESTDLNQAMPKKMKKGHPKVVESSPLRQSERNIPVKNATNSPITSLDVSKFTDKHFLEKNRLVINGSSTKLCDYYFELDPKSQKLSLAKGSSGQMETRDLFELKELMFWPGVGVSIELPGLTIERYCTDNCEHELIHQQLTKIKEDHLKANKEVVFRYQSRKSDPTLPTPDVEVELSLDIVLNYVETMIKCIEVSNYVKRKEIEYILRLFYDDLNKLHGNIMENVAYSYFINNHQYYRVFEQDVEMGSSMELLHLREIYNPEIIFKVRKCDVNYSQMTEYFKAILIDKDPDNIEELNTMLAKGYTLFCVGCRELKLHTGQYNCSKRILYMSQHIGAYRVKEFNCVQCNYHANIIDLVKIGWSHSCEEK